MKTNNYLITYLVKFVCLFALLYFGTHIFIGLTTPGGQYYFEFLDKYFNYVSWLRSLLLNGARVLLAAFGYDAFIENSFDLRLQGGLRVHMVYSCLGYGLLSFWTAFIAANKGSLQKKISWIVGGFICICLLNITRVALLLLANNYHWKIFSHMNHHTMFSIAVYVFIFLGIFLFDRSSKKAAQKEEQHK